MLPKPHAHLIVPRLYLGDKEASMDPAFLKEKGITTVFNCTKDLPFSPLIKRQYRVPVDDDLQPVELKNMENWSPEIVAKVLREYNQGQTILVHCFAGKQRSAAVMAMTLIAKTGKTFEEVHRYIQSVRPVAFTPQVNFEPSIRRFETMLKRAVGM